MPRSARKKVRRGYRGAVAHREMPSVFNSSINSDESFKPLLERFHATRSDCDRNALIVHLLPYAGRIASTHYKRLTTAKTLDDLDVLVGDIYLNVFYVVERYHHLPAESFLRLAQVALQRGIFWGYRNREGGRLKSEKNKLIEIFNRKFTREQGRKPTRDERDAYLANLDITSAMCHTRPRKKPVAFSAMKDEGLSESRSDWLANNARPETRVVHEDLMAFALNRFDGEDREIFRLAVEGMGPTQLGNQFGISKASAQNRINTILWRARCHRDLARALGVEPSDDTAVNRAGRAIAISNFPPARLVG